MAPSSALSLAALALAACLGLGACAGPRRQAPPSWPPLVNGELGSMRNVSFSEGLWFGGAPTPEDLDLAGRRGVERVIDLCARGREDLAETCERLGLEGVRIALDPEQDLRAEAVDRVLELLGQDDRPGTLMFCEDGATSAALFAIHRVVHQGVPLSEALAEARRAGMRADPGESRVHAQIERLSGPADRP